MNESLSVKIVTKRLKRAHLTGVLSVLLCLLSLLVSCTPCEPSLNAHLELLFEFFCLDWSQKGVKREIPLFSLKFMLPKYMNESWFGLVVWTPSRGRKVGIPRGILPHVQGGLNPLQPDSWSSSLPGIREGSYGQFNPNTT